MPKRIKLYAVVASVMLVTAACGGGEGDVAEDPAQDITDNILPGVGGGAPTDSQAGQPIGTDAAAQAEDLVNQVMDDIEGSAIAVPKGGYLSGGFFYAFDVAMLGSSGGGSQESSQDGYEGLTTVTISQDEEVIFVRQSRGANDGDGRYSCQQSVHEAGLSQLTFEVVANGEETYYWNPTLSDPEVRAGDSPEIEEAIWLCPSKPGFFDEVPEFFTLGDVIDKSQDAGADGSTSGWHFSSRMDAAEAGLDTNDYQGEVLVVGDATRTPSDVDVRWPPLAGTYVELVMEEPSS